MFIGIQVDDETVKDTPIFINTNQITSFVIKYREITMSDGNTYRLSTNSFKEILEFLRNDKKFFDNYGS